MKRNIYNLYSKVFINSKHHEQQIFTEHTCTRFTGFRLKTNINNNNNKRKHWWLQIQNLGFMKFNSVINTYQHKNALMIKNPVLGMF